MARRKPPHRSSLLARLTSVPYDPEDSRAFLQRRVTLYVGFLGSLWLLTFPVDLGVTLMQNVSTAVLLEQHFTQAGPYVHFGTGAVLIALWRSLRRSSPSVARLGIIEAAATIGPAITLAYFAARGHVSSRPELTCLLGVVNILAARAATIPSKAERTAVVSAGACMCLIVGATYLYTARPLPPEVPALASLIVVTVWSAIATATATLTSSVIYGLASKVREAQKLGQYTLEEKIGGGGMGIVYRARHALLRRPTAVKVLPPDRAGESELTRFEREVQLTSKLNHPNIVTVYDFGRSPRGLFYYAMELIDGVDLQRLVEEDGAQSPARVLHLLRQAAEGLAEAHAVGLIHRDVKPANMILCDRVRHPDLLKVVDFGLVKVLATNTSAGKKSDITTLKGTPLYLSPESIATPDQVDARADLYALGAVGYFLLTARPVFEGLTLFAVCAEHLHSTVIPIKERAGVEVPAKLEAVLLRCLAKKRDDRFASADELLAALLACDDVPAWSDSEAAAWWADRAPLIKAKKKPEPPVSGRLRTLAIERRD